MISGSVPPPHSENGSPGRLPACSGSQKSTPIGHYFYPHDGGNAVNFIHGAVVGPFIHLVQAEILAAAARLAEGDLAAGHHEMTVADRQKIAAIWLDYYRSNA